MVNHRINNWSPRNQRELFSGKRTSRIMIAILVIVGLSACLFGRQVAATSFIGLQDNRQQETAGKKTEEATKNNQVATSATPKVYTLSQDEYFIGLQDVLEVKIQDAPELSSTYTVGGAGTIEISPFNKKLRALGKTPEQVAAAIKELLIEEDYLKKPIVNVDVKEYNSRQYYITGTVAKPGNYTIKGKVTMLSLLNLSGGLTAEHGPKALIIRKKTAQEIEQEAAGNQPVTENGEKLSESNPPTTATTTKLEDAAGTAKYNKVIETPINGLDKGILAQDIPLEPGDHILIAPLRTFLIGGEVVAPGPYPLKEGTSLKQAVVLARGLTPNAAAQKAVIFRANEIDGKQEEVKVDLSAIMSGKKSDVSLRADDLIVIPNSRMKTIGNALLRSFGVQTLTRAVLY